MQQLTKFVKTSNIIALSFMVLTFVGCSKGGDTPTPTPPTPNPPPVVIIESDIAFSVKIDGTEVNYNGIFGVVFAIACRTFTSFVANPKRNKIALSANETFSIW